MSLGVTRGLRVFLLMLTCAGVLAASHLPHPPADGSQQPEQLPGHQDQGHGGRGLVRVRADDPQREGV